MWFPLASHPFITFPTPRPRCRQVCYLATVPCRRSRWHGWYTGRIFGKTEGSVNGGDHHCRRNVDGGGRPRRSTVASLRRASRSSYSVGGNWNRAEKRVVRRNATPGRGHHFTPPPQSHPPPVAVGIDARGVAFRGVESPPTSTLCEARCGVFPPTTTPFWCTFGRCSPGAVFGWNGGGAASCGMSDAAQEASWAVEALAAAGTLSALLALSDASAVLLDIFGILLH